MLAHYQLVFILKSGTANWNVTQCTTHLTYYLISNGFSTKWAVIIIIYPISSKSLSIKISVFTINTIQVWSTLYKWLFVKPEVSIARKIPILISLRQQVNYQFWNDGAIFGHTIMAYTLFIMQRGIIETDKQCLYIQCGSRDWQILLLVLSVLHYKYNNCLVL